MFSSKTSALRILRPWIRKYTSKSEFLKILRREEKANFGPLLETSRERKKRVKTSKNEEKNGKNEINEKINNNNNNNNSNENELSWVMKSAAMKNVRIMKIRKINKKIEENKKNEKIEENEKNEIIESNEIIPSTIFSKKEDNFGNNELSEGNNRISLGDSFLPIFDAKKEDKWENSGVWSLKPKEEGEFRFPGVTRILNETMSEKSKEILEKWKEKMIKEIGEEGFEEYSKKLLKDSKIMHQLVEKTLRKEPLPDIPVDLQPCFNSIKVILKDLTDVRMLESHVVHPTLGYRGFIDCVAKYRGNLCIIDWKKSEKIKSLSTTYDSPLQLSAYIGALNADPNYPFQVKSGILGIAYTSGQLPSVFQITEARLEFYWREWLKRLEKYKTAEKCI